MQQVLIIHNDKVLRQALADLFILHHFKAIQASTIDDGFQRYQDTLPDLVICDHYPTHTNGLDLLNKIRQARPKTHTPCIFMVDDRRSIDKHKILLSQYYVLTKPFSALALLAIVEQAMSPQIADSDRDAACCLGPGSHLGSHSI